MGPLESLVDSLGGFAQKRELVAHGATDRMLTAAVRFGRLRRPRRGWYSTRPEDDPAFRAMRVGGRLTGISALAAMGAWRWDAGPLHVSLPRNAARQRDQRRRDIRRDPKRHLDVAVHWDAHTLRWPATAATVHPMDALVRVSLDEPFEVAVAVFDWAFRAGLLDSIGLEEVVRALPASRRLIANWVDPACESIPESVTRTRLGLRGFRMESQVPVGDFERIDLVVEHAVALEVDGRQHAETFERDRRKDLRITIAGLHPLRPTYRIVRDDFDAMVDAIVVAIRARDPSWQLPDKRCRAPRARRRRPWHWRSLDASLLIVPLKPPLTARTLQR